MCYMNFMIEHFHFYIFGMIETHIIKSILICNIHEALFFLQFTDITNWATLIKYSKLVIK